jgi:hypothetical protein
MGMRPLSQSLILTEANRTRIESFVLVLCIAFITNAVAVLKLDFANSDSYQILFNPPLACKLKLTPEQKVLAEVLIGGDGIATKIVFTPVDKGPSQPDLTQDARKIELSDATSGKRLPSPNFVPRALYQ